MTDLEQIHALQEYINDLEEARIGDIAAARNRALEDAARIVVGHVTMAQAAASIRALKGRP